ncbi:zinc finger, CCHC-type containing protein [Tanacetum coccineum]
MAAAMKHMASNFAKLEKFEGVDYRKWQKKMHFLLSSMSVVYVLTTPMPEDRDDNPTVDQVRRMAKWDNNDYVYRGLILNDFKHTLKHLKEELTLVELGSHLRIEESLWMQDNDKPKGNNIFGPLVVNMVEHDNSSRHNGLVDGSSNSMKGQNMFNKSYQVYYVTYVSEAYFVQDDDVAWWVDSGATMHVCKDRCWFKTYESLNDGSILHIGNESTALVHGRGCVDLSFSDNIGSAFMSTSKLNDSILWHARLGHVHFKRMQDMSKDGLILAFDMDTKKCKTCMLTKNVKRKTEVLELIHGCEHLVNSKVFKTKVELQQGSLIKRFRTDWGGEYMDTLYFQSVGIIHETTAPYTPQQNGISEWKNKALKEMVNSMLSYLGLSQGAVVRLLDPKLKILGERGIECIFVGYVDHSKAFKFYVTEEVVQQPEPELKKSKRHRTPKDFGPEFQFYLIEGVRDEVSDQHSYCFNVEDDPKIFDKVLTDLSSRLQTFWGCKWIFKRKLKVDRTVEKFKARLVIQGFRKKVRIGYFDTFVPVAPFLNGELDEEQAPKQSHQKFDEVVLFNGYLLNQADKFRTPIDTSEKLMPNNGHIVSQLEYSRVIEYLMYAMTCTRSDIAFAVGKLSKYTSNPGYTVASWISNTEDNSSTSGWVFLLGAVGKEAEWLENLLLKIPLWHSMIRELIINGVVSIEFVRSQQNLADHLMKGLARDLVIKYAKGDGD